MTRERHIIRKLVFEVEADTEAEAVELQNELSKLFHERFQKEIEGVLDVLGTQGDLRVDSLDLNIGQLDQSNLEEQVVERVVPELYNQLESLIQQQQKTVSLQQDIQPTGEPGEALRYYLESGRLPWWVEVPAQFDPAREFAELTKHHPHTALGIALQAGTTQAAAERLVLHIGRKTLEAVLRAHGGQLHHTIEVWLQLLQQLFDQTQWALMRGQSEWERLARVSLWQGMAESGQLTVDGLAFAMRKLAVHAGKTPVQLVTEMGLVAATQMAAKPNGQAAASLIKTLHSELTKAQSGRSKTELPEELLNRFMNQADAQLPDHWQDSLKEVLAEAGMSDALPKAEPEPRTAGFTLDELLARLRHLASRTDWSPELLQRLHALLQAMDAQGVPNTIRAFVEAVRKKAEQMQQMLAAAQQHPVAASAAAWHHTMREIRLRATREQHNMEQLWQQIASKLGHALPASLRGGMAQTQGTVQLEAALSAWLELDATDSPQLMATQQSIEALLTGLAQASATGEHPLLATLLQQALALSDHSTTVAVIGLLVDHAREQWQHSTGTTDEAAPAPDADTQAALTLAQQWHDALQELTAEQLPAKVSTRLKRLQAAAQTRLAQWQLEDPAARLQDEVSTWVRNLSRELKVLVATFGEAGSQELPQPLEATIMELVAGASQATQKSAETDASTGSPIAIEQAHEWLRVLQQLLAVELPPEAGQLITALISPAKQQLLQWRSESDEELVTQEIQQWVDQLQQELKNLQAKFGEHGTNELPAAAAGLLAQRLRPQAGLPALEPTTTEPPAVSRPQQTPDLNKAIDQLADELETEIRSVNRKRKPRTDDFNEVEQHYIDNAGLVVVWPFLQRFFSKLNLLDEEGQAFANKTARQRAMCLLQRVATGQNEIAGEHLLTFNKLLTGTDLEEPVVTDWNFTEAELEETDNLIMAVIANVPMLSNSTIAGYRSAFMQRSGALEPTADGWILKVERKTHDIILEKIPWGLSAINLPWIDYVIYVEW